MVFVFAKSFSVDSIELFLEVEDVSGSMNLVGRVGERPDLT
jgi:hypothetical protein